MTARRAPSSRLDEIAQAADRCRARATALIDDDARAYRAVVDARRATRTEASPVLMRALVRATEVPLDVISVGHDVLEAG